jgi:hypothetical protein
MAWFDFSRASTTCTLLYVSPSTHWHVTSATNRESIRVHGLDWRLMASARGIAGSLAPEQEGCFLCQDQGEVEWFVRLNNTGGPVDVWEVAGIEPGALVLSPEGHHFYPGVIDPERLRLVREDVQSGW